MPEIHVHGAIAPGAVAARRGGAEARPLPAGSSAGEVAFRAEREFLVTLSGER